MSRIESFTRMFTPEKAHGEVITRVEIPLIQRDYAQGRRGEEVDEIRRNFLSVMRGAVSGGDAQPISLDFVYGERLPDGALQPLDGQQRLTTLFLLHWFLASRSDNLSDAAEWTNFTYETRPSARRFCQRLVASTPDVDAGRLSAWVTNQSWYLFMWRYDPTINSMLVMLDAIQDEFGDVDAQEAWERLVDPDNPAISFHLLPLPDMGSAEDLYVKMNSRGKPLTDFENFKARFEGVIEWSPAQAADFALMADTAWSDILWNFRGNDDLVDDEFLRYFDFVTEVCQWSDHQLASDGGTITRLQRATRVFGEGNPLRADHVAFLFTAFNVWKDRDVTATFAGLFDISRADAEHRPLPLFFRDPNINLFEAACRNYGEMGGGGNRIFTFGQTLLLYAVVIHLAGNTNEFRERLRALRNLVEGSQFEMRAERLPRLLADTRELIENGVLPEPGNTFAVAQISDETEKRSFLVEHPELAESVWDMEDHGLLKGSTTAFSLDAQILKSRWAAFDQLMSEPSLWWDVTGALLAYGEYQWPRQRNGTLTDSESFQFGTWDPMHGDAWREVLVGRTRADAQSRIAVLGQFLDSVAASSNPIDVTLQTMQANWLQEREAAAELDWRYYMVKYQAMRAGASGLYYAHGRRMGFSLTNLPGGKKYRNANFYDPYLLAVYRAAGEPDGLRAPWFSGYEWDPRWLRLTTSGVGVRCVPAGYELLAPTADEHADAFKSSAFDLAAVEIDGDEPRLLISVAKAFDDENGPDSEDRIEVGVRVVRRLIKSGL